MKSFFGHTCTFHHFVTVSARPSPHVWQGCVCKKFGLHKVSFFLIKFYWRHKHRSKLLWGTRSYRSTVCQLLCITPALLSLRNKQPLPVLVCSWQASAPRQLPEKRQSTTLERVLNSESFFTQLLGCSFFYSKCCFLDLTACILPHYALKELCQGFGSFPKQRAGGERTQRVLGDGSSQRNQVAALAFCRRLS